MKHKLLIATAAIALMTGSIAASAQNQPSEAPAASHSAPMKSGKSGPAAQDHKAGPMRPGTNAQRPDGNNPGTAPRKRTQNGAKGGDDMRRHGEAKPQNGSPDKAAAGRDARPDRDRNNAAEHPDRRRDNDRKRAAENHRGPEKMSPQQRTKIRQSFRHHRGAPHVKNVNFNISVGTAIPARIRLAPIPVQVIAYYPRWRGYRYFIVGDEIVVVHPRTHEIVAVLPA